jgi:DNA-binding XRE family transcriptional regulator
MRSSGPQPAVGGNLEATPSVISMPITAKSPPCSSQMSGHPRQATVCVPLACGSGPIRRRKMDWVFMATRQLRKHKRKTSTKYSAYTVVRICGFGFPYKVVKIPKYRKALGENIRMRRRNLKWSQEKLSEKSDLHHNYIGDIERGEENVSVDALRRIAIALGVRLTDLVRDV